MNKFIANVRKNNKGFTLVELIIVIAIIAVLAVVIAPQYLRFVEDARIASDVATATSIEKSINIFIADGTYTVPAEGAPVTITWDVDGGTIKSGTAESTTWGFNSGNLYTQLNVAVADDNTASALVAESSAATDVTWTITNTGNGNVTVTVTTGDYKTW